MQEEVKGTEKKKACTNCGAELRHKPGSNLLECGYCGYEELIDSKNQEIQELELEAYLSTAGDKAHKELIDVIACKNCGSNQQVHENLRSLSCLYCGEPFIVEDLHKEEWILPGAVLPFQFDKKKANQIFKAWIGKVWFAPDKLKKATLNTDNMQGLYIPFWTFDADASTTYYGQRGDYYYESETYRSNGKTQTRQVQKTRWTSASGEVSGFIDDVLVNASSNRRGTLPAKVNHWNHNLIEPFDQKYLSGYTTEKYTISLREGHTFGRKKAEEIVMNMIRRDIGGDTQRIIETNITYQNETFKHVLYPIYLSSFMFKNKQYNFFINAQSGKISGKYPLSILKIILASLLVLAIIVVIAVVSQG